MTTLEEVKAAIEKLPDEERTALLHWLASVDRQVWDEEIGRDFSPSGRGSKWLEKVDREIDRGDFSPLG